MSIASQVFVFLLMLIAGRVTVGLMEKRNMWRWIIAYWVALTVKNMIDFLGIAF